MKPFLAVALVVVTFIAGFSQRNITTLNQITETQAIGDKVFFAASHNDYGLELLVTEGGSGNVSIPKDINPGPNGSAPSQLTVLNNELFFLATTVQDGLGVWKSDGTAQGTQLVYAVPNAQPWNLTAFKGKVYFTTDRGSIMRTDGTPGGTEVFYQSENHWGRIQTVVKDDQYIYFTEDGRTIYRDNGTSRINFPGPLSWEDVYFRNLLPLGNSVVVIKSSSYSTMIRMYAIDNDVLGDAEEDEWRLIKKLDAPVYGSQQIENFTHVGESIFFSFRTYYDQVAPTDELWVCDGTEAGTKMVKSFTWRPHEYDSEMGTFFAFKNKLFFRGGVEVSKGIWSSDGTADGTVQVHNTSILRMHNVERAPLLVTEEKFFFSGGDMYNQELWESDGTSAGTRQLMDIEDDGGSWPRDLAFSNGLVYFVTSKQYFSTLWSTMPSPDISLWSGNRPIPLGSVSYQFYVAKGACQTADLVIRNKGLADLYLNNIYITGKDVYLVKQTLPEALAPEETVTIKVVANPISDGTFSANLTILSNDKDESSYTVTLQGSTSGNPTNQMCAFQNAYVKALEPVVKETPIVLSNAAIAEHQPEGTVIGTLSLATGTGTTFALSAGEGDADNERFSINGNQLISNTVFDYNVRSLYTIHVKATSGESSTENSFRIRVNNISAGNTSGECEPGFQLMGFSYTALESNSAGHLFVTTHQGQVLRSKNAGETWEVVYAGDPFMLTDISFNGNSGIISGQGILLKSDDGGVTWSRLYLPHTLAVYTSTIAASLISEQEGYAGTSHGEFFFTADGGHTWEVRAQNVGFDFHSLFFVSRERGYAVNGPGNLALTINGGRSWSAIDLSSLGWDVRVQGIWFLSATKGFMVTWNNVYMTTNAGQSWTLITDVDGSSVTHIRFFNERLGFLYGGNGIMYKTTNGGDTWEPIYGYGVYGNVVGIAQSSGKFVIATRGFYSSYQNARAMAVSSDEGATWSTLNEYSEATIYDIQFHSDEKGIIVTAAGGLLKTEDNGLTWKQMPTDLYQVADVQFLDESTVILVEQGHIYKSTDGGATTRRVLETEQGETYKPAGKLYAFPGDRLFSVSWYAMYRSDDLGETWSLVSTMPGQYTHGLHFISPSVGYRMEFTGSVEKSVDGGTTWTSIFARDPAIFEGPFNAIFYLDENLGYKGGDLLQRTTDGGYSWETVRWPFYEIIAIHFEDAGHGYVVTRRGEIQETTDAGATWKTILSTSARLSGVQFFGQNIYVGGEYGFSAHTNTKPGTPSMPGYIYGPDRICAGDAVEFRLAVDSDDRAQWSTTASNVDDRRDNITVRFSDPGTYTVSARLVNACGTSDWRGKTVQVSGSTSAPSIDGPVTASTGQQDVAYSIANASENSSFLWAVKGGTIASSVNDDVVVDWASNAMSGEVSVLTIDAFGCRASGSLVVALEVPLGIEEYFGTHVSIYPNPSEGETRISSSYNGSLEIRIIDTRGVEYYSYTLGWGEEQTLRTRDLPPGLYLVRISDGQQSVSKKLIRK